jgi:hypothetical protein
MNRRAVTLTLIVLALVAGTGGLLAQFRHHQRLGTPAVRVVAEPLLGEKGPTDRTNSVALPRDLAGYNYKPTAVTDLELSYLPADTIFGRGIYTAADDSLEAQASVVLMGADRTSIHRPEYCLVGTGWQIVHRRTVTIPVPGLTPSDLAVQRFDSLRTVNAGGRQISQAGVYVFYFVADGRRTASQWERQWSIIRGLVVDDTLQRWAYISFFAVCAPGDEDRTFDRLSHLIAACAPRLETGPAALAVAIQP